jgi:ribosomal protein L37E
VTRGTARKTTRCHHTLLGSRWRGRASLRAPSRRSPHGPRRSVAERDGLGCAGVVTISRQDRHSGFRVVAGPAIDLPGAGGSTKRAGASRGDDATAADGHTPRAPAIAARHGIAFRRPPSTYVGGPCGVTPRLALVRGPGPTHVAPERLRRDPCSMPRGQPAAIAWRERRMDRHRVRRDGHAAHRAVARVHCATCGNPKTSRGRDVAVVPASP